MRHELRGPNGFLRRCFRDFGRFSHPPISDCAFDSAPSNSVCRRLRCDRDSHRGSCFCYIPLKAINRPISKTDVLQKVDKNPECHSHHEAAEDPDNNLCFSTAEICHALR